MLLKLMKPAKVPSFGARSGGVGSLASAGVVRLSVMPVDGTAASSVPEASLTRSGAVSAARSWSIFHLNLSQPLGSSAAQAGTAPSNTKAMRSGARMLVYSNHNVRSLHDDGDVALGLDAQVIDRLVGDRGGDGLAVADIDTDMRRGRALLHFDDGAFDLIACTDAHESILHNVHPVVATACIDKSGWK